MAYFSDEHLLAEFEKIEDQAEKALEKVHAIYKDVMGCSDDLDFDTGLIESNYEDYNGESISVNLQSPLKRKAKKPVSKATWCEKCHKNQSSVVKGTQTHELPKENIWYSFQLGSVLPETSYRNPIEHCDGAPKIDRFSLEKSKANEEHFCPLRVTVPQPFQMTLRELQQRETKDLARIKLKEKWNKNVENELGIRIHARPVPGHIRLPLYQKIVETYEQKKLQRKEQTSERLKDLIKPFNLTPQNFKKFHRSESMPNLASSAELIPKFKAKPVPMNILGKHVTKNIKAREEKRKFRIAERSQELLKSSSLPFSKKKLILKRSLSIGNLSETQETSNKLTPNDIKNKRPKNLSRLEQKEIFEQWNNKVAAVNHQGAFSKDAVIQSCVTKAKDFLTSQALPFYDIPVKMTAAAMLREKQNRALLNGRKTNEEQQFDEEVKRKENEKQLKKHWGPKLKEVDPTLDMKRQLEEQLKNYRESRLLRQQEYEKELNEMKMRVEKQPLLVERQSQVAKRVVKFPDFMEDILSVEDESKSKSSDIQSDSGSTDHSSSPDD